MSPLPASGFASGRARLRRWGKGVAVSLVTLLLLAALTEAIFRLQRAEPPPEGWAMRVCRGDCAYVFSYTPGYRSDRMPQVNSLGFIGPEVPAQKKPGTFRLIVLGDSVATVSDHGYPTVFPRVLQEELSRGGPAVELLNASVNLFSPYNHLRFFEAQGRHLSADLVLVSVSLNDVVEPNLHWMPVLRRGGAAPLEGDAIPNLAIREQTRLRAWLERHSEAVTWLMHNTPISLVDLDQRPPVYLTGEQRWVTMHALLDYGSAEWRWLRRIYDQLIDAARSSGAEVAFLLNPLGYQLEPGYPYAPQESFARFCAERGVSCIDPLPQLREAHAAGRPTFIFADKAGFDVWHYRGPGHRLVARALAQHIRSRSTAWARLRQLRTPAPAAPAAAPPPRGGPAWPAPPPRPGPAAPARP